MKTGIPYGGLMKNKTVPFFLVLLAFCGQAGQGFAAEICQVASSDAASQVLALDQQIKQLKIAKEVAERNAYLAGNKADMVMDNDWLAYRNALAMQTQYEQEAQALKAQIAALEKQRAQLVNK
jgi:hypothetical protein